MASSGFFEDLDLRAIVSRERKRERETRYLFISLFARRYIFRSFIEDRTRGCGNARKKGIGGDFGRSWSEMDRGQRGILGGSGEMDGGDALKGWME